MTKDVYYYTEKFFEKIRESGNIDYEEYWNRRMLGYEKGFDGDIYTFSTESQYGNGDRDNLYSCISKACSDTDDRVDCVMHNQDIEDNCFHDGSFNTTNRPIEGDQIYGQYSEVFFDRNRDANNDNGDENGDGDVRFDRDDRDTGQGPSIIGLDTKTSTYDPTIYGLPELYLIAENVDSKERTFFRHILRKDTEYIQDQP